MPALRSERCAWIRLAAPFPCLHPREAGRLVEGRPVNPRCFAPCADRGMVQMRSAWMWVLIFMGGEKSIFNASGMIGDSPAKTIYFWVCMDAARHGRDAGSCIFADCGCAWSSPFFPVQYAAMHDCRLLRGVLRSSRPANIPTLFTNAAAAWAPSVGRSYRLSPCMGA